MVLNGCLAGLVAVTAPCAFVSVGSGAVIGLIGGVLVVLGVIGFDKAKIDDPVGALSVHLLNGIWGTLALGLFYDDKIAKDVAGLANRAEPRRAVPRAARRGSPVPACTRLSHR